MIQKHPWAPYPEALKMFSEGALEVAVSRPSQRHVVMGASGRAEQEVYEETMAAQGVPLYKRKGGGGTVLLGPQTIVVTVHAGVTHTFRNLGYFSAINNALMAVFKSWKDLPYAQKGISDIAVDDRKIVGSSIYRSKHYLLYQASILVELDLDGISQLLRHPPREPDYRKGRGHGAFLTCLRQLGITQDYPQMISDLTQQLPTFLPQELDVVNEGPAV